MQRNCQQCHLPITGRSDKRFCDDACRNGYNNKRYATNRAEIRQVNRILARNRQILSSILEEGMALITREFLSRSGFSFDHCTGIYEDGHRQVRLCYDYAYSSSQRHDQVELMKVHEAIPGNEGIMLELRSQRT
ncbi:MAG: hypothetical protein KDD36_02325 [Flavobacteriales bacterium]|nr:hypothetical protein [Flavobacteriales bacterium]